VESRQPAGRWMRLCRAGLLGQNQ